MYVHTFTGLQGLHTCMCARLHMHFTRTVHLTRCLRMLRAYPTCCPLVCFSHIGSIKDAARMWTCGKLQRTRLRRSLWSLWPRARRALVRVTRCHVKLTGLRGSSLRFPPNNKAWGPQAMSSKQECIALALRAP